MYEHPEIKIPFLFGENYQHHVLPYERIEAQAPDEPGIYAWFFRIRPSGDANELKFIDDLYQQRVLKAQISGPLRLQYTGWLHKNSANFTDADISLLRQALVAFPIPLYLGISSSLQRRLSTHKKELEYYLGENISKDQEDENVESDSEQESRSFGQRLGVFWRDQNFYSTDSLYVKYLTTPSIPNETTREEKRRLQEVELVLNSLLNPVFGRR